MAVENDQPIQTMLRQGAADFYDHRGQCFRLQRKRAGKVNGGARHAVIYRGRDHDLVALFFQMRRRRRGVCFGGERIHPQGQVRAMLLDDTDRENRQRFAGSRDLRDFRKRHFGKLKHLVPRNHSWSSEVLESPPLVTRFLSPMLGRCQRSRGNPVWLPVRRAAPIR